MAWNFLRSQQQRGAQLHARSETPRQAGEAPAEAVAGRSAQDHEQAGGMPQPGDAPASDIVHRDQDNTPTAPDPHVEWDEVVQPERVSAEDEEDDGLPLPEGK